MKRWRVLYLFQCRFLKKCILAIIARPTSSESKKTYLKKRIVRIHNKQKYALQMMNGRVNALNSLILLQTNDIQFFTRSTTYAIPSPPLPFVKVKLKNAKPRTKWNFFVSPRKFQEWKNNEAIDIQQYHVKYMDTSPPIHVTNVAPPPVTLSDTPPNPLPNEPPSDEQLDMHFLESHVCLIESIFVAFEKLNVDPSNTSAADIVAALFNNERVLSVEIILLPNIILFFPVLLFTVVLYEVLSIIHNNSRSF